MKVRIEERKKKKRTEGEKEKRRKVARQLALDFFFNGYSGMS
jgi:hypothetical protein